jgi:Uri superfamily endonuclease
VLLDVAFSLVSVTCTADQSAYTLVAELERYISKYGNPKWFIDFLRIHLLPQDIIDVEAPLMTTSQLYHQYK